MFLVPNACQITIDKGAVKPYERENMTIFSKKKKKIRQFFKLLQQKQESKTQVNAPIFTKN